MKEQRAGTVELNATVNGKEMYTYMAPGCCGLRTMYGFDGKRDYATKQVNYPTPEEVLQGIVESGISGSVMIMVDVYNQGEQAKRFKTFVEGNNLGTVTIAPPVANIHTGAELVTVVFCYNVTVLQTWLDKHLKAQGQTGWTRPNHWHSNHASVHMDSVFYQGGGRPKPLKLVARPAWLDSEDEVVSGSSTT